MYTFNQHALYTLKFLGKEIYFAFSSMARYNNVMFNTQFLRGITLCCNKKKEEAKITDGCEKLRDKTYLFLVIVIII